jgi:uroporphyrinogen decarboxylase
MFDMNQSLFLRALRREPVERTPLWIMRQAGRYLPEYRKVRALAGDFLTLCKTPELACEVSLQPLQRFKLDAGIVFSDILTIPDAMGLGLFFVEGEGPRFRRPLCTLQAIQSLPDLESGSLNYVMQAIKLVRRDMPKELPLIGFSGSPWTLSCYMIQGGSSTTFEKVMRLLRSEGQVMHLLLQKLTAAVTQYLIDQANAGANVLMIFDTWGGLLEETEYSQFSLAYLRQIVAALKVNCPHVPIILFRRNSSQCLEQMAATGCDAVGVDWTCNLHDARQRVGERVALQGNLDPNVLLGQKELISKQVAAVLAAFGHGSGHVFNLGHGIVPGVPPEHVTTLVEAVRELSPAYHLE